MIHRDFKHFMETEVLQRRAANPEDIVLDGGRNDSYTRPAIRWGATPKGTSLVLMKRLRNLMTVKFKHLYIYQDKAS